MQQPAANDTFRDVVIINPGTSGLSDEVSDADEKRPALTVLRALEGLAEVPASPRATAHGWASISMAALRQVRAYHAARIALELQLAALAAGLTDSEPLAMTIEELARRCNIGHWTTSRRIQDLVAAGVLSLDSYRRHKLRHYLPGPIALDWSAEPALEAPAKPLRLREPADVLRAVDLGLLQWRRLEPSSDSVSTTPRFQIRKRPPR